MEDTHGGMQHIYHLPICKCWCKGTFKLQVGNSDAHSYALPISGPNRSEYLSLTLFPMLKMAYTTYFWRDMFCIRSVKLQTEGTRCTQLALPVYRTNRSDHLPLIIFLIWDMAYSWRDMCCIRSMKLRCFKRITGMWAFRWYVWISSRHGHRSSDLFRLLQVLVSPASFVNLRRAQGT